ncbi:hypothetical protein HaLaN_10829 [Haematococcus lacustris]|uniref:Uncharacterized protein n=1 Tax=Haematococcus lacustris TaxID=44745 RepID=A0A699Z6H6_HAELA|nr:hypothetical protein HaLaN_10829 [Haematococcus lacustris]
MAASCYRAAGKLNHSSSVKDNKGPVAPSHAACPVGSASTQRTVLLQAPCEAFSGRRSQRSKLVLIVQCARCKAYIQRAVGAAHTLHVFASIAARSAEFVPFAAPAPLAQGRRTARRARAAHAGMSF